MGISLRNTDSGELVIVYKLAQPLSELNTCQILSAYQLNAYQTLSELNACQTLSRRNTDSGEFIIVCKLAQP